MIMLLLLTATSAVVAQSAKFGIKGGLNFGSTGEITDLSGQNFEGDNQLGYHIGLLTQFKFAGIFIQPEIMYTSLTTDYAGTESVNADYELSKLDVPVLIGFDIVGPLNFKIGPSFQYILNNELVINDFSTQEPENSITVGYQLGAGLQLGRLGLDLRYESAFSQNDTSITQNITNTAIEQFTIDSRPTQWILSVSYIFGDSKD